MSVIVSVPDLDAIISDRGHTIRQRQYSMRVAFYARQYVPRDENTLRASEPLNSRYEDGLLIWSTPYALKQYSVPMKHTTAGTQDHWDEAVRKNHMSDLKDYVSKLYGR